MFKKIFYFENKILLLILVSLVFHFIAAYFSVGYYQQDEHFSVLEPINYKLGKEATLGWDFFQLYDRSWFLTSIFYLITKLLTIFNIYSPFKWAFAYRLFASLLGWLSIICLINISKKIFLNKYSFYSAVLVSTLLWFYPYFHARTSSENLGCSLLIIGITLFLYSNKKQPKNILFFISGIIFGLSFLARYTNIVPFIGFGMWVLIINKNKFDELFFTALGFTIIFLTGILIDYWGYNQILLSSLNYYLINFEHNQLGYFPSFPWWYYFYFIIKEFLPPLSIIILFSMLLFWLKLPKHFVTWTTLPLFIFLSSIAHKETRFLFPILIFSPLFIGCFVDTLLIYQKNLTSFIFTKFFLKIVLGLVIIINFAGLITLSIIPANNSINLFKFLYKNPYKIEKLYTLDNIPYRKSDLLINFYRNTDINFVEVMNTDACMKELFETNGHLYSKISSLNKLISIKFWRQPNLLSAVYHRDKTGIAQQIQSEEMDLPEWQILSYPKWIFEYKILCNKQSFIKDYILKLDNGFFLFSDTTYLDFFYREQNLNCKMIYNTLPMWFLKINYNNWLNRTTKWYLFSCEFKLNIKN